MRNYERTTKIKNKYNLKPKDIQHAIVLNKEALHDKPFWYNNIVKAWCLSGGAGEGLYGGYEYEYWIGFYDDNAPAYKNKIRLQCSSYEGMCNYTFKKFFDLDEIKNKYELQLQQELLKVINWLIDSKIIYIEKDVKSD